MLISTTHVKSGHKIREIHISEQIKSKSCLNRNNKYAEQMAIDMVAFDQVGAAKVHQLHENSEHI
jgi:hypothetical protein